MPINVGRDGEGVIVINDFTGGLNTFNHPLLIADNQTPTASNVWASGGALTKRRAKTFYPLVLGATNTLAALAGNSTTGSNSGNFGHTTSSGQGGSIGLQTVIAGGAEYLFSWVRVPWRLRANSGIPGGGGGPQTYAFTTADFLCLARIKQSDWTSVSALGLAVYTATGVETPLFSSANNNGWVRTTIANVDPFSYDWHAGAIIITATSIATGTSNTAMRVAIPYSSDTNGVLIVDKMFFQYTATSDGVGLKHVINFSVLGSAEDAGGGINRQTVTPHKMVEIAGTFFVPMDRGGITTSGAVSFTFPSNTATGDFSCNTVTAWPATWGDPIKHKNYLFVIDAVNKYRLRWSALNDGTVWPTDNYVDVGTDGGLPMVKLIVFNDSLVMVKKNSLWVLVGQGVFDPSNPTYELVKIDTPNDFFVEYPDAIMVDSSSSRPRTIKFLTTKGLVTFTGQGAIKLPEDQLVDTLLTSIKPIGNYANYERVPFGGAEVSGDYAGVVSFQDHLFVTLPVSGIGRDRRMMVKDTRGSWWAWDSVKTGQEINSSIGAVFNNQLFFSQNIRYDLVTDGTTVSTAMGVVREFIPDQYSDTVNMVASSLAASSLAITADWKSKIFDIGYGHLYNVSIFHSKQSSGNLDLTWWIDGTNSASASFDMSQGQAAAGGLVKNTIQIGQPGHSIQFKIANAEAGVTFEIFRIQCRFRSIPDEEVV